MGLLSDLRSLKKSDRICQHCTWWDAYGDPPDAGVCRRDCPSPPSEPNVLGAKWPTTHATEWCGDWELR